MVGWKRGAALALVSFGAVLSTSASAVSVTGFTGAKETYFRNPVNERQWIGVNHAEKRCFPLALMQNDKAGVGLYETSFDRYVFIDAAGRMLQRTGVNPWAQYDHGGWIQKKSWAVDVKVGEKTNRHFLAWVGRGMLFLNDPRNAPSDTWYQIEEDGNFCHVFSNGGTTYSAPTVQRVRLSPPLAELPGWSVGNGKARIGNLEVVGDWLTTP